MIHQITVTYDDETSGVNVLGVPANKVIALGMIAVAEAFVASQLKPNASLIAVPAPGPHVVNPRG